MELPKYIEFWDEEESMYGLVVMVTLSRGWSFSRDEHSGVCGFETRQEARIATRKNNVYRCDCDFCIGITDIA